MVVVEIYSVHQLWTGQTAKSTQASFMETQVPENMVFLVITVLASNATCCQFSLVGETSPNPFDNFFKIGCAPDGAYFLPERQMKIDKLKFSEEASAWKIVIRG